MDKESTAGLFLFVVAFMALCAAYVAHSKNTFSMDKKEYTLAGVLEYKDKEALVYVPVYKRIN